ncbi:putative RNA helicase [Helianthus annuus]|nr:putative RNA helicase [Helianthus annuus]
MTDNLQSLLEVSANKAYFYEAYEGFQTVDTSNSSMYLFQKALRTSTCFISLTNGRYGHSVRHYFCFQMPDVSSLDY